MANKSSPSTQHHQRSQAIRQAVEVLSGFLTEEVLLEIQNAAADADTWQTARTDIHKYLESKRITIPEGISISVLQAAPAQTSAAPTGLHQVPPGPPVCPPGTEPILVLETVQMCLDKMQIVVKPPRGSSPGMPIDPDNIPPPLDPPRIITEFCMEWGIGEVLRWRCKTLPRPLGP